MSAIKTGATQQMLAHTHKNLWRKASKGKLIVEKMLQNSQANTKTESKTNKRKTDDDRAIQGNVIAGERKGESECVFLFNRKSVLKVDL